MSSLHIVADVKRHAFMIFQINHKMAYSNNNLYTKFQNNKLKTVEPNAIKRLKTDKRT